VPINPGACVSLFLSGAAVAFRLCRPRHHRSKGTGNDFSYFGRTRPRDLCRQWRLWRRRLYRVRDCDSGASARRRLLRASSGRARWIASIGTLVYEMRLPPRFVCPRKQVSGLWEPRFIPSVGVRLSLPRALRRQGTTCSTSCDHDRWHAWDHRQADPIVVRRSFQADQGGCGGVVMPWSLLGLG
jgi:hypothetical protein